MDTGILWIYPVTIAKWTRAFPRVTERVALWSGLSIRRKPRTRTHIWLRYLHLQHVLTLSIVFVTVGAFTCLSRRLHDWAVFLSVCLDGVHGLSR